jgi:hypothetical protein
MTADDLRDLLDKASIPSGYAAAPVLGVPVRTVQSWLAGKVPIPKDRAELVALALVAEGYLPAGRWLRHWVRDGLCKLLGVS